MTGAPREAAPSRDALLTRHPRTQRTIAGLVSITPEPPLQQRMLPPPPQQSPAPTAQAARLAMAAAAASEASLEVSMASPSIELAWRVVQAAESRKALLDQRALSLRVRRTVPAPGSLNTTYPPSQKSAMSPQYREPFEDGPRPGVRPPLPTGGSPARHHHPPGFPLLQVSSWLRDDAELRELRSCEGMDVSPFSTALLERGGGLRKRRPKHPQRVIHHPQEEEDMSGDFSVSGVRLGTQRRGVARLAPDLNALKAKKAFGAQSCWSHGDPAALAEALTIALGQLQQSSWNEADEDELAEAPVRETSRTPEIEDAEDCRSLTAKVAPALQNPRNPRKLAPVRIQEDVDSTLDGDDSPSATWPPGPAAKRRGRTVSVKALLRSKSLPGEKGEKGGATEKEKEKVPVPEKRGDEDRQAGEKIAEKTPCERVTYDKAKRPNKPLTLKSDKSAAGAGASAAKSQKKKAAKKMVLPFSYGLDDPRYWHVESTEGRACPEFLPENRA